MNRRRLLTLAGLGTAIAGTVAGLRGAKANVYYAGPVSDHFDGTRFFLPGGDPPRGFSEFLRWQLGGGREPWPEAFASPFADEPPPRVPGRAMRVALIGHASFLVQTGGANILIDPVYAERASPLRFAGPKRVNAPGIAFEKLPKIDCVLITHNHYDHLCTATLNRLHQAHQPRIIAPLGNDAIIRADYPYIPVETLDWSETAELAPGLAATLEPAQHWSARSTFDRMHALWGSFVLESPWGKLYAAGDTGFGDGELFRLLAARHPDLRLGLLPIGAYEPRWFMRYQHVDPAEAVEMFRILGLEAAIGYHWGTFRLTNEGIERPREALEAARAKAGLAEQAIRAFRPGEVWTG